MSTNNHQRNLEIIEKSDVKVTMEASSNVSIDPEFSKELEEIYNHIESGSITRLTFKTFIEKVFTQMNDYKQQLKVSKSAPSKAIASTNVDESAALIAKATLVLDLKQIQSVSPKYNSLSFSFYHDFLTFYPASKADKPTLIKFENIDRIISVPQKTKIRLIVFLKEKTPLNWRKSSLDCFALCFEDMTDCEEEQMEEFDICNLSTSLPTKLKGSKESVFCRVISELSKKNIDRHDKSLYRNQSERDPCKYFVEATIKFNKVSLYPLRCGLLIIWSKMRFVNIGKIHYYEYVRQGMGLRYYDIDIVLFEDEEDEEDENDNKKKKRKKENIISLTMIDKKEITTLDYYFKQMKIAQKKEGETSPKRNRSTDSDQDTEQKTSSIDEDGENEDDEDFSDSDDEEYKIEDEEDEDEDIESDYEDDDEDCEEDEVSDNEADENEDIDMKQANKENDACDAPLIVEKASRKKRKRTPTKRNINRKRKRNAIEVEANDENELEPKKKKRRKENKLVVSDDDEDGKENKFGRISRYARKSTNYEKSTNIVSKTVAKKPKSPKNKKGKKTFECVDCDKVFASGLALGGHRGRKHPKTHAKQKSEEKEKSESVEIIEVRTKDKKHKKNAKRTLVDMFKQKT